MTTDAPEYMVFRSRLQISGRNVTTCSMRRSGVVSVVPRAATDGSSSLGTKRCPGPVVRLMMMSVSLSRMRCTTSR